MPSLTRLEELVNLQVCCHLINSIINLILLIAVYFSLPRISKLTQRLCWIGLRFSSKKWEGVEPYPYIQFVASCFNFQESIERFSTSLAPIFRLLWVYPSHNLYFYSMIGCPLLQLLCKREFYRVKNKVNIMSHFSCVIKIENSTGLVCTFSKRFVNQTNSRRVW